MKSKKLLGLAILALLLTTLKSIAQPTFPVINNLACDVKVAIEIGDISMCSPYTPCNSYQVTIPPGGTHIVTACTGILSNGTPASGNLDELCITLIEINGTPVFPSHSINVIGSVCCLAASFPIATGPNFAGCGPPTWNITRTFASWVIN